MAASRLPLIASAALLLAGGAITAAVLPGRADPREAAGAEWMSSGTTLVWAIRPKDLVSCRSAGYTLRRIQRAHGGTVRLVVASVGADTGWVASMLRSERLRATIQPVSEREYRTRFSGTATPRVFVVNAGKIVSWHVLDAAAVDDRQELEQVLSRLSARG